MPNQKQSVSPASLLAFEEAVTSGNRGQLDTWLEENSEQEVRAHILALMAEERKRDRGGGALPGGMAAARARIAVAVATDGAWSAIGTGGPRGNAGDEAVMDAASDAVMDLAEEGGPEVVIHSRYWVEVDIPVPAPGASTLTGVAVPADPAAQ